ncbi:hypothetical protein [Bacillus mycoides]|uniref:hypothetical protein n=1 Tax=Bacillus mycoides TaxID=1405 RepID=UPI00155FF48A|nr:hypothetical protein [Bacillus mycoides]
MYLALQVGIIVLVIMIGGYATYGMFKGNWALKYYSLFIFIVLVASSLYMLSGIIKVSI